MSNQEHNERAGIVPGLIPVNTLPRTRLELRWEHRPSDSEWSLFCHYELVLELMEYDIRGEVYDDDGNLTERKREKRIELGGTKVGGTYRKRTNIEDGTIDTPFRDHTHIRQDALRLGLPAYVIEDGWAMRLRPSKEAM